VIGAGGLTGGVGGLSTTSVVTSTGATVGALTATGAVICSSGLSAGVGGLFSTSVVTSVGATVGALTATTVAATSLTATGAVRGLGAVIRAGGLAAGVGGRSVDNGCCHIDRCNCCSAYCHDDCGHKHLCDRLSLVLYGMFLRFECSA
jgi:hypothetical protein